MLYCEFVNFLLINIMFKYIDFVVLVFYYFKYVINFFILFIMSVDFRSGIVIVCVVCFKGEESMFELEI